MSKLLLERIRQGLYVLLELISTVLLIGGIVAAILTRHHGYGKLYFAFIIASSVSLVWSLLLVHRMGTYRRYLSALATVLLVWIISMIVSFELVIPLVVLCLFATLVTTLLLGITLTHALSVGLDEPVDGYEGRIRLGYGQAKAEEPSESV